MKYANVFAPVSQTLTEDGAADGSFGVQDPTRFPLGARVNIVSAGGVPLVSGIVVGYTAPCRVRLVKGITFDATTGQPNTSSALDMSSVVVGCVAACGPEFVSGTWTGKYDTLIPGNTIKVTLQNGDCASPPTLVGGVLYQITALVDCWIKMNATAANTDMYIPAKVPHVFAAGHIGERPVLHIAAGGASSAFVTPLIPALNETI